MSKRHFTLAELISSKTADELGIVNIPNFQQVSMLALFVDSCLEPIREAASRPVYITSGYRCPALNKAVGGVANSYHQCLNGHCAADITLGSAGLNKPLFSVLASSSLPINELKLIDDGASIHVSWHPWIRKREVIK